MISSSGRTSKLKTNLTYMKKNIDFMLLAAPILVYLFIFKYIPMFGLIIPFLDYKARLGVFGSPWLGFKNFEFLFRSGAFVEFTRNTILYNLAFVVVNTVGAVIVSLLLFTVKKKFALKIYQTSMFLPFFISFIVVGYIVMTFLNPTLGMFNKLLAPFGIEIMNFYNTPTPWVFIIPLVNLWKSLGYMVIIFYATLMGISQEYYEAAEIDGAGRFKQALHISLPFLKPIIVILTLISIGYIFRSDFGLFYLVPMQETSPALYSTTDVIDTYIYRALKVNMDIGMASAAGFYQSIVGFLVLLVSDKVVKRFNEGNGLF